MVNGVKQLLKIQSGLDTSTFKTQVYENDKIRFIMCEKFQVVDNFIYCLF